MICRRRRAIFLIEMLPVLLAIAVGGGLMLVGLTSIIRSQRRVAELGNRYAVLNDFMRCLRTDVRAAADVALRGDDDGAPRVLAIGEPPQQVLYRFLEDRVERVGRTDDPVADKVWNMEHTVVQVNIEPRAANGVSLVNVTVEWHRASDKDPQPRRRFDATLRCAREVRHEPN